MDCFEAFEISIQLSTKFTQKIACVAGADFLVLFFTLPVVYTLAYVAACPRTRLNLKYSLSLYRRFRAFATQATYTSVVSILWVLVLMLIKLKFYLRDLIAKSHIPRQISFILIFLFIFLWALSDKGQY